ncbi:MAG: hypothetical protein IKP48_07990 [Bacteroidaceae bacterium]|nr:hypothetical protein [Bacteroidaceae bacterium]
MEEKRLIAINTMHTGNGRYDNRGYAVTKTSEQVDSLLSEDWLRKRVAEIRDGNEKLKDSLPFICPHYSRFNNNHRAQADIIPEAFTYMTCVDVDDKELVDKAIQRSLELNADTYSEWFDQVLRMEYSARKKVHIYIRIPKGMTIEEAQKAFCKEIDVPYDESCTTPERFIYLTGIDEEIYRSEHWLEPIAGQELEERREAFLQRGLDVDGRKMAGKEHAESPARTQDENIPFSPATERTRYIFNACMKECELEAKVLVEEGARHEAVKSILSVGAAQLLTKAEFCGVLSEMMPANWADKNIQDLVSDFYQKYTDPHQKMTQFQRRVFARSRRLSDGKSLDENQQTSIDVQQSEPPVMPAKIPKLIQLLTSNTPDIYKAAVAHAVFPPLATHLCDVRFSYTDNVEHEATLMNCLMAGTGAGKGCIDEPIRHIMADIKRRDQENERREAEWKKDCQKRGANKDKMMRPEGLVIQIIDADMTKPALVTRMDEAEGHFVYVKLNELDLFEQLKGQTGKQHFQLMCLAFDPGAEYGQTRVGTQSVTARPECRFNWNACTTILKGRRFFSRVLTDGPISRINFCTIPETEIGAEQPIYGQYDAAFDEALKPYIDNLVSARGLIDCQQAYKLARRLQQECAEFARLSQSEVYWNLSHRAIVIAWLKACVLYVANGQKWERSIEDFIRWSLEYDLWCKMQFFGNDIEKASNGDDARIGTRGPRNLLQLLKDEFTLNDVKMVRQQEGFTNAQDKAMKMIRAWMNRGYVIQNTEYSFQKSDRFRSDK